MKTYFLGCNKHKDAIGSKKVTVCLINQDFWNKSLIKNVIRRRLTLNY